MKLSEKIIQKLMDNAIVINSSCKETCSDFQIMTSKFHKDTLILRWLEIDISDIVSPIQCYRYRCFNLDGSSQDCSIHYNNRAEANAFFKSLIPHYTQEFAVDHKQ